MTRAARTGRERIGGLSRPWLLAALGPALAGLLALAAHGGGMTADGRLVLQAAELAGPGVAVEFARQPRGGEVARIEGVDLAAARGITIELAADVPMQVRLLAVFPGGGTRTRYVVLAPASPSRRLTLPWEAFDPDPEERFSVVPPGGALVLADAPGFRRVAPKASLAIGRLSLLAEAPPLPAELSVSTTAATSGRDELEERILAGWRGKLLGGELGMPTEGHWEPDFAELARIDAGAALADEGAFGFGPDDDSSLCVQTLLEAARLGRDPAPLELVSAWLTGFSPEYHWKNGWAALARIRRGAMPPESGRGPLGEAVCARIRAEPWAFLHPGDPARAAALARADAEVTSHDAGVDDALFVAGSVAAAFTATGLEAAVEAGLAPVGREYRTAFELGWRMPAERPWSEAWGAIRTALVEPARARFHEDAWAMSLPNAALMGLALSRGRGELLRTARLAAALGLDADCNAATLGCLLGVLGGARALPGDLAARGEDRLRVAIAGREHWDLRVLAALTRRLAGPLPVSARGAAGPRRGPRPGDG